MGRDGGGSKTQVQDRNARLVLTFLSKSRPAAAAGVSPALTAARNVAKAF
jgi:hypothetical protein